MIFTIMFFVTLYFFIGVIIGSVVHVFYDKIFPNENYTDDDDKEFTVIINFFLYPITIIVYLISIPLLFAHTKFIKFLEKLRDGEIQWKKKG